MRRGQGQAASMPPVQEGATGSGHCMSRRRRHERIDEVSHRGYECRECCVTVSQRPQHLEAGAGRNIPALHPSCCFLLDRHDAVRGTARVEAVGGCLKMTMVREGTEHAGRGYTSPGDHVGASAPRTAPRRTETPLHSPRRTSRLTAVCFGPLAASRPARQAGSRQTGQRTSPLRLGFACAGGSGLCRLQPAVPFARVRGEGGIGWVSGAGRSGSRDALLTRQRTAIETSRPDCRQSR